MISHELCIRLLILFIMIINLEQPHSHCHYRRILHTCLLERLGYRRELLRTDSLRIYNHDAYSMIGDSCLYVSRQNLNKDIICTTDRLSNLSVRQLLMPREKGGYISAIG